MPRLMEKLYPFNIPNNCFESNSDTIKVLKIFEEWFSFYSPIYNKLDFLMMHHGISNKGCFLEKFPYSLNYLEEKI